MKEILVLTGCQGFIGMNFLERVKDEKVWLSQFDEIISIETGFLGDWNLDRYFDLSKEIGFSDIDFVDIFFDATFTVVNFAGSNYFDKFIEFETNISQVKDLVETLGSDRIKNFYHMRSGEEFGCISKDEVSEIQDHSKKEVFYSVLPFEKDSELNPCNPYSASKANQTLFLRSLKEEFGLKLHEFVLGNQYGKYQHTSKFIPKSFISLSDGDKIKIYGDGKNIREWCFVEDTVDEIFKFIESESTETTILITNPNGLKSNLDITQMILDIHFGSSSINLYDHVDFVKDKKGHDFCHSIRPSMETDHFVSLEEGLTITKEFYDLK